MSEEGKKPSSGIRAQMDASSTRREVDKGSFKMRKGMRNYIIFSVAYGGILNFLYVSGIYNYLFKHPTVDIVVQTTSIVIAGTCIAFIYITND